MRRLPRAPAGTGLAGRLALSARSSDGTASVFARFRPWGLAPGRALGALLPGPGWIRGGATIPCREHGEERQHGRRPAQGQPKGAPRLGRAAVFRLVDDAPCIACLAAPCGASPGAGAAPEILPGARPRHPGQPPSRPCLIKGSALSHPEEPFSYALLPPILSKKRTPFAGSRRLGADDSTPDELNEEKRPWRFA
jgi:hypothetical protein